MHIHILTRGSWDLPSAVKTFHLVCPHVSQAYWITEPFFFGGTGRCLFTITQNSYRNTNLTILDKENKTFKKNVPPGGLIFSAW